MDKQKNNKARRFLRLTSIPFEMFIIIFGGFKLGMWLDKKYPNENQLYTLIVTLVAVFLAMAYIARKVQKMSK